MGLQNQSKKLNKKTRHFRHFREDILQKLHRRAARLIVRNQCSDAALQSLAMESLENRRKNTYIAP